LGKVDAAGEETTSSSLSTTAALRPRSMPIDLSFSARLGDDDDLGAALDVQRPRKMLHSISPNRRVKAT
jgi:hypothetical protein